jgi:hypothetical protein
MQMANNNSINCDYIFGTNKELGTPSQQTFLAVLSATASNVTGDNTAYTVIFDSEIYDVGASYATGTGIYTSLNTGKYCINFSIALIAQATGGTNAEAKVVSSNRTYTCTAFSTVNRTANLYGLNDVFPHSGSLLVDMDVGDTAYITITSYGGAAKVDDIYGNASPYTYFCGYLAC